MHQSVLLKETIAALAVAPGGTYIDGTLGSGGHALAVMERAGVQGRLLGIDRDAAALERARRRLAPYAAQCTLVQGRHGAMQEWARRHAFAAVDGIVLDLGVSSDQLDTPERGFSFRFDAPLDMRMDPTCGESAQELLARVEEAELLSILRELGQEPQAARVARALMVARGREALKSTGDLARVVEEALGRRGGARHPATRVFQALRMAVNDETGELVAALTAALDLLRPGGRLAVITFESITDRIVKQFFVRHVGRWVSLQEGGRRREGAWPAVQRIKPYPVKVSRAEMLENPRARSAKLRAVEVRAAALPGSGEPS